MALQIQLRSGTATEHNTFTGALGEVTVDTTNKTLRVHDGTTAGGTRLATLDGELIPASQLPDATTAHKGAVTLNDTLTSTSTLKALTAAQGKVLSDRDFGVNQTWQYMTASRALNTTYTNSTGKPISVIVHGQPSNDAERLSLTVDGLTICDQSIDGEGSETNVIVSGIIPVGSSYFVSTTELLTTVTRWVELR